MREWQASQECRNLESLQKALSASHRPARLQKTKTTQGSRLGRITARSQSARIMTTWTRSYQPGSKEVLRSWNSKADLIALNRLRSRVKIFASKPCKVSIKSTSSVALKLLKPPQMYQKARQHPQLLTL